jgi:hypothetical protein
LLDDGVDEHQGTAGRGVSMGLQEGYGNLLGGFVPRK